MKNNYTSGGRRSQAAALKYSPGTDDSPKVVAIGTGYIADEITRLAKQNGVPVRNDPQLSEALADLDLGDNIPPELYGAVAEVLAFVYRINKGR